jgi:hypothetical protein
MARALRSSPVSFLPLLLALSWSCSSGSTSGVQPDAGHPTRDASLDHAAPVPDAHADATKPRDGATSDAVTGDSGGCHATLGAADRTRKLVVSHPFDNAGNASADFEVFDIDDTGAITEPDVHFTLGASTEGVIAFTPDGSVGLLAEDDGTLGVFRFDASGAPHVVSASLKGSYYATGVVMDPSGDRAYVMDDQTTDNGGGIYVVLIACDGTLTDGGLLTAADLPATVIPVGGGDAVVLAKNVKGVPAIVDAGSSASADGATDALAPAVDGALPPGNDAVLVPWPSASKAVGAADPFQDELAIVSAATLTSDGRYVLLGDNSQFSGVPNRVGVVAVGAGTIASAGVVENVNDPEGLVASPFDDTVLVTSAFDNALYVLRRSEAGAVPFVLSGPVTYQGPQPQLPGNVVMIDRGMLKGRVLVAENQAIRELQFAAGAVVTDLGPTSSGDAGAPTSLVGAIGVQP